MADHEPESSPSVPPPPFSADLPPAPPPPEAWSAPPVAPSITPVRTGTAERLASRARLATVGIGANLLATLIVMVAVWRERTVLVGIRDGVFYTDAELESVDAFTALAAIGYIVTWIFAIVTFLRWFSRAYKNIGTWSNNEHADGWAVGAWFVPFLNLWRPFKIAEEIIQKSPEPIRYVQPWQYRVWWGAFVGSNFLGRFLFRRTDDTLDAFIVANTIELVSDVVWLVAGAGAIWMIRHVTAIQDARIEQNGVTPTA